MSRSAHAGRRRAQQALLGLVTFVLAVIGGPALPDLAVAATLPATTTATSTHEVTVAVRDVSPTTISPSSGATVGVTVSNRTSSAFSGGRVTLEVGGAALDSQIAQSQWLSGERGADNLNNVKTVTVDVPELAPGRSADLSLTLPSKELDFPYAMATLPMRVQVLNGSTTVQTVRSFLSWVGSSTTFSTPVESSVVVPVTLPADPALLTATGSERFNAWNKAIGPGSAIDKLLSEPQSAPVTWLIDPAVLDPAEPQDATLPKAQDGETGNGGGDGGSKPSSSGGPTSSSASASASSTPSGSSSEPSRSSTSSSSSSSSRASGSSSSSGPSGSSSSSAVAQPTTVAQLAARLREKLRDRPKTQQILFTPYGDPDLSALTAANRPQGSDTVLRRALARQLPSELTDLSDTVVAAPVAPLDAASEKRLTAAWKATRGSAPIILTPDATLSGSSTSTVTSPARRTSAGATMIGYEAGVSKALAQPGLGDPDAAAVTLADTLAVYQQQPDVKRSFVAMGPRDHTISPSRLDAVLTALEGAGWTDLTSLDTSADSVTRTAQLQSLPPSTDGVQPSPGTSGVTAATLATSAQTLASLERMTGFVTDGDDIMPMWSKNLDQVTSTRWRGHAAAASGLTRHAREAVDRIPTLITVVPSSVNFFSDSGLISVTVTNGLSRQVRDLRLVLRPRSYIVQFRSQPKPFTLEPNSQTTVRVETVAQAAGQVSVLTELTAPNGVRLGDTSPNTPTMHINARPTGTWIFWGLGIVALLIFCYGLFRKRKKGTRRRDELARDIQL